MLIKVLLIYLLVALFAHLVKDQLAKFLSFFFDQVLGAMVADATSWLDPLLRSLRGSRNSLSAKLTASHVMFSLFLFVFAAVLTLANYQLILYGMEVLIPGEAVTKVGFLTGGQALSIVVIVAEIAIGMMIMEAIGFIDLLNWTLSRKRKYALLSILCTIFVLFIGVEVSLSVVRTVEFEKVQELMNEPLSDTPQTLNSPGANSSIQSSWAESFFKHRSPIIAGVISALVPIVMAFFGYSLRDVLLIIFLVSLQLLIFIFAFVRILVNLIYAICTKTDNTIIALLDIVTYPIKYLVNLVLLILIKIKLVRTLPLAMIILALSIISFGCFDSAKERKPSRAILALIDNSGSFRPFYRSSLNLCNKIVQNLRPGDSFSIIMIKAESHEGYSPIISIEMPELKTHAPTQRYMISKRNKVREFISQIDSLVLIGLSKSTDINGALNRSSSYFGYSRFQNKDRYLFIFSDLKDTVRKKLLGDVDFTGVKVKAFFVSEATESDTKLISSWKQTLGSLHASSVEVLTPDQSRLFHFE